MIVFINLQGNPLHALAGLLVCFAVNAVVDFLTSGSSGSRSSVWLELAAGALGLLVTGLLLAVGLRWFTGAGGAPNSFSQVLAAFFNDHAGANAHQQRQQQTAQQRQQRWDKVVRALQKLPTDTVLSEAELQAAPAHELKARLHQCGTSCEGCVEKQELINKLQELGGSSAGSCCICCEEYVGGDVVRVLPCKHRFHIECVDRWFLSSTDYSRAPACPMCNAELAL